MIDAKERRLRETVRGLGSAVVAFSGGVDSAYLAYVATSELGARTMCVTADSPSYPAHHRALALKVASQFGLHHEFITTNELSRPDYQANPANRCYFCKHELYTELGALARARGFASVIDGNNADNRGDYRPGRQAAREFAVRSPLDEVDLGKLEIRELSRLAGLPTWDEPASACLSSRIPYFSPVTPEKLQMIESAEAVLRSLGFRVCRVRHHDETARLEIGSDELAHAVDPPVASVIVRELTALGYRHITLDLQGYRSGSLNEVLPLRAVGLGRAG